MADYIGREDFIADAKKRYCEPCKGHGEDYNGVRCRACWVDDMISDIDDASAADVEPVRHGRWIPCSERLPQLFKNSLGIEYSETFFVFTSGRKIMAAFMLRVPGDKAIWIAPFNFWAAWDEEITHWTEFPPLPEPPEEGACEG